MFPSNYSPECGSREGTCPPKMTEPMSIHLCHNGIPFACRFRIVFHAHISPFNHIGALIALHSRAHRTVVQNLCTPNWPRTIFGTANWQSGLAVHGGNWQSGVAGRPNASESLDPCTANGCADPMHSQLPVQNLCTAVHGQPSWVATLSVAHGPWARPTPTQLQARLPLPRDQGLMCHDLVATARPAIFPSPGSSIDNPKPDHLPTPDPGGSGSDRGPMT